jgi:hypothetical protein
MKHADLVRHEEDYVRKLQEVNKFDNVILEICDGPSSIGTGVALAGPWVSDLLGVARNTESAICRKAYDRAGGRRPVWGTDGFFDGPAPLHHHAQYLWGPEPGANGGEMGGMRALDYKYDLNKPIELNETDWYPWGYRGDKIAASRVEA